VKQLAYKLGTCFAGRSLGVSEAWRKDDRATSGNVRHGKNHEGTHVGPGP
jgi:hypothetical protein